MRKINILVWSVRFTSVGMKYKTFQFLLRNSTRYLKHHETLASRYNVTNDITTEFLKLKDVKSIVYKFANEGK